jgi:hypothetical protein
VSGLPQPFAAIWCEVDQLRDVGVWLERRAGSLVILDLLSFWIIGHCGTRRKGRFYERNQYLLRSADRAVHDPAAALDAQAETREHRVSLTKDVPSVRIDHIPTQSSLPGVWRGQRLEALSLMVERQIFILVIIFMQFAD